MKAVKLEFEHYILELKPVPDASGVRKYLTGTIEITGGTDATATLTGY